MKIHSIQYIRAFAALLVVYVHLTEMLFKVNMCGDIGVDLFFVTSGFIITYAIEKNANNFFGISFFLKRLRRIYPLYFFMTVCFSIVLVIFTKQMLDYSFIKEFIKSILFIPSDVDFLISPFFIEFLFGILVYYLLFQIFFLEFYSKKFIPAFFYVSIPLFIAVSFGKDYGHEFIGNPRENIYYSYFHLMVPRALYWGIPSVLLFLCTILFFHGKAISTKWVSIGNISYSIYLVQVPIILIYWHYFEIFNSNIFYLLSSIFISVSLIIGISYITNYLIEKEKILKILYKK